MTEEYEKLKRKENVLVVELCMANLKGDITSLKKRLKEIRFSLKELESLK